MRKTDRSTSAILNYYTELLSGSRYKYYSRNGRSSACSAYIYMHMETVEKGKHSVLSGIGQSSL